MSCQAEFLVEPFNEGDPGPHVMAAIEAVRQLGFEPDFGPFGTTIDGEAPQVIAALQAMLHDALINGATRVSLQFSSE